MLYFLILSIFCIFIISYYSLGRDLFQPSCIINITWFGSSICSLINKNLWKFEIHFNTVCVCLSALLCIYFVNFIFYRRKSVINHKPIKHTIKPINVSNHILLFFVAIQFLTIILYYKEVVRIVGRGYDFHSLIQIFRATTSYGLEDEVSFLVRQLVKLSLIVSIVFIFVFVNNSFSNGVRKNKRFLIPSLIYFLQSMVTSGRYNLIVLLISAIITMGILKYRVDEKPLRLNLKVFLMLSGLFIAVSVGFYGIKYLVGRESDLNIVSYIATYMGGSIPLLDMFLQDTISHSEIWGKETFYEIINSLSKYGIIDVENYIVHLEFRTSNGINMGNVYTALRRPLADFGFGGMLLLQGLFSAIMSYLYNRVKLYGSNTCIIIYSFIAESIFLHFYHDHFYTHLLSFGTLIAIIMLIGVYAVISRSSKNKLKIRRNKCINKC